MTTSFDRKGGLALTAGLAVPVITTAVYMQTLGGPSAPTAEGITTYFTERWSEIVAVWLTETVGFALAFVAALCLAVGRSGQRAALIAIALGSLGGLLSTAIGLGFFRGFGTAGEAALPLFFAVLNGSFFFFFIGKALTAIGAIGLGLAVFRRGGLLTVLGGATVLAGLVGFVVNLIASGSGLAMTFPGGLTGTIATAFAGFSALALTLAPARAEEGAEDVSALRPQHA